MSRTRSLATLGFLSAALAGCSDTTGPEGEHQLQVRAQVTGLTGGGPALAPGISSVQINEALLVLGGLKLETAGVDQTVDWAMMESVVLDLDLAGEPTLALDVDVPAGTYKELEISIDKLEVGHPEEQSLINQWPALADASVLVTGTLIRNGVQEAFAFTAALDIDLELLFPTILRISGDEVAPTRIAMTIDLGGWFQAMSGAGLDPNDLADRSAIEAAITRSIEVLKEP